MEYQLKQNAKVYDLKVLKVLESVVRGEVASWFTDNCFTISLFDSWVLHSLFLLLWIQLSWIESLPCDLINLTALRGPISKYHNNGEGFNL